tara:strand:- start:417 stop:2963 length:2547 start_codon:yes stop_codon:yes gene_type:complete
MNLMVTTAQKNGVVFTPEEANSAVNYFEAELKRRPPSSQNDIDHAFDVSREKSKEVRLAALQSKREAFIRAKVKANIMAGVTKYKAETGNKSLVDGYNAYLVGSSKMVAGSRNSVSSTKAAIHKDYAASFELGLNRKGGHLEDLAAKGTLDAEVYIIAYTKPKERASLVDSGEVSKEALDFFESMSESTKARLTRKNNAGAYIGERDDYLGVSQSGAHNSDNIRRAGFDEWKATFLKEVDQAKTFKGLDIDELTNLPANATARQMQDEYLNVLYNEFVTGRHHYADKGSGAATGRAGSANIAKKLSASRTIHFKDGPSAFRYAQKFARGNLYERFYTGLEYDARNIALLEKLGPNPELMHNTILDAIANQEASRGVIFDTASRGFSNANYRVVSGGSEIPDRISLAKIGSGVRAVQGMAKLGGAVLSAFPDIVFKAATINRKTSRGFLGSYKSSFDGLASSFVASKDKKQLYKHLKIYTDQRLGEIHALAGDSVSDLPGFISSMQKTFYRWNLLGGWTQGHKNGLAAVFANELATYRKVDFDKLPDKLRRTLGMYDISSDEWATFRNLETFAADGEHYIVPDSINDLGANNIDPIIRDRTGTLNITDGMRSRFRDDLRTKLMALINDSVDEGVVTVGDRERAIMTLGQSRGSVLGEFVRYVGQFKSFPVTVITKQLAPEFQSHPSKLRGGAAIAAMVLATTALGYLSGAAKDAAKGKEPKDPKNIKSWLDALTRGGGLGIYGDFLFSEYNRYGQSLQETLLGPSFGTLNEGLKLIQKTVTGEGSAKDYARFIKSNTPFANLFWTEQAMNYLIWNGAMEWSDPGYMRSTQRRIRREYNQDYWLPPSSAF